MSRRHPGSKHHAALDQRRWARARKACFDRDGWRCTKTKCGAAGRLEAHHVVPLDVDPEQDPYAIDGLATVCRDCHIREHHPVSLERSAWRRLVRGMAQERL